jgi:hypothetical protein
VELLITAAELHIQADLGVVDAAEKSLEVEPADVKTDSPSAGRETAAEAESEAS